MSRRPTLPWLVVPLLAFFAAFFLAPMTVVVLASFSNTAGQATLANYVRVLLDQYHWEVLAVTLRISFVTTLICAVLSYPVAYYLVRIIRLKAWRRACVILIIIPLFTSNVVRSFGWMVLLGRNGLINEWLTGLGITDTPVRFLGTELGVVIGLTYILLPFMILSISNSLAAVDPALESAAADLFAGPAAVFRHITFPLCVPGLLSGMIIVFTLAVSAYVTPALLSGGRVTVFPILIFQQYSSVFHFHYGGALSMVLLFIVLCLVTLTGTLLRTREAAP
jgi:putative spermidine/putrescine transport system permease protein